MSETICGNNTICSNDLIVGAPPSGTITLDLSQIGLLEGIHAIQMQLSDDNVTKMDSNLSNSVSYTVTAWDPPVQEGDILSVAQIYDATQVGDILYVDSVPQA